MLVIISSRLLLSLSYYLGSFVVAPSYADAYRTTAIGDYEFLVTNRSEIWRVKQNSTTRYLYETNATAIADLDYHLDKNLLFWIDSVKREINSRSLDVNSTGPIATVFKQDDWEPIALAVDFVGDKLYVVDIRGAKIDVLELDGSRRSILIGTNLVRPLDIELDPYDRLMFVLDGFRIIRANMDGSAPVNLIRQNIHAAHGLSIDVIDKKLYWVLGNYSRIISANYLGDKFSTYEVNLTSKLIWSKFAVVNESMFWAVDFVDYKCECSDKKIYPILSLRTTLRFKPIYESNPVPSIRVIDQFFDHSVSNPCESDNGGCQHMCIFASNNTAFGNFTRRCLCEVGWKLDVNLKNCTEVGDFLMYTQPGIMKIHLVENFASSNEPYLPISEDRSKFIDFDYDYDADYVYYVLKDKNEDHIVYKIHPNRRYGPAIFMNGTREKYQSVAIDWLTGNLYYVDSFSGVVRVTSTKNATKNLLLLDNLEQPEDIVIHPRRGYIFFLQTNETTRVTGLSRANADGTNLTMAYGLVAELKKRCGFAIDYHDDRIYWYEWRKAYVRHANFDFDDLQTLQSTFTKFVYTISIYEKWMYVATTNSEGIYRIDKITGQHPEFVLADASNRIIKVKTFAVYARKSDGDHHYRHPCLIDNGGCREFCFGIPVGTNLTKVCTNDR